jgi:alkylhydroperoxidase family enzyme
MIAVLEGRLEEGGLTPAERALMDYVRLITEESHKSMAEDVQKLRDVGWTENQIAEAVYVTAMFAFFNRVADAFGIAPQNYLLIGKLTP